MLPLIFLIFGLMTPCFMAPIWSDDYSPSFFNHNDDDDYLNMFGTNNNHHDLPETNLIFTPNGVYLKAAFNLDQLDDLFKNENTDDIVDDDIDDTDSLFNMSPDYPSRKNIYNNNMNPVYKDKHFSINTDLNIDDINNEPDTGIDDIDSSIINESYLKSFMDTLSLMYQINEIIQSLGDDESILLNNGDNDNDSKDDGITVIGHSNINPNVEIKLTFDKFDDDKKDDDDDKKNDDDDDKKNDDDDKKNDDDDNKEVDNDNKDNDDENKDNDDDNKKDDSDEIKTINTDDDEIFKPEVKTPIEIFKNSLENDDDDDDDNDDDDDEKQLLKNKIIKNDDLIKNTIKLTTTGRPTEWDESNEITKSTFINGENFNFVPYDNSDTEEMTVQPQYKLIY